MRTLDCRPSPCATSTASIEMLREVLQGRTYEAVAVRFDLSRTAVERRVKGLAAELVERVGVDGLDRSATRFVQRLRAQRRAVLEALERLESAVPSTGRARRVVSEEEVERGAARIGIRSEQPSRDQALFYLLFATGARPLEVARLVVGDYLQPDGRVRISSEMRAEVSISGRRRPLYFSSPRLNAAMDRYLAERSGSGSNDSPTKAYRGLEPWSPLFVDAAGEGFIITRTMTEGRSRFLCRQILETYRRLFRQADMPDVTPVSARRMLASRLHARGGDEEQLGLLFGLSSRRSVRRLLPAKRLSVSELMLEGR